MGLLLSGGDFDAVSAEDGSDARGGGDASGDVVDHRARALGFLG